MTEDSGFRGDNEVAWGRTGAVRATRLREIQNDILSNLGRHALSIDGVASRHGISPSYVRQLFAAEDTTFSKFSWNSVSSPRVRCSATGAVADRSIAAIAFEAGFGDLPSFNRIFRRQFGIRPAEARDGAG